MSHGGSAPGRNLVQHHVVRARLGPGDETEPFAVSGGDHSQLLTKR